MKNVASGLPAISLIPARKRDLGSGGRSNPETAATECVGEVRFQRVPVPTAFTERYGEVDAVANKPDCDLPSKLLTMTLEDNPNLTVPATSEQLVPPPAAPRTGTTAVDLEPDSPDSDSSSVKSVHSSSSSSSTSDAADPFEDPSAVAAVAALELARAVTRAEPAAVATVAALEQARAARAEPAAIATVASLEQARAAARAATAQMQELD